MKVSRYEYIYDVLGTVDDSWWEHQPGNLRVQCPMYFGSVQAVGFRHGRGAVS
jgi:hypothetical protein